jgi:hypothetical protein
MCHVVGAILPLLLSLNCGICMSCRGADRIRNPGYVVLPRSEDDGCPESRRVALWVIYPPWLMKRSSWARIVGGIEGEPKYDVLGSK